MVSNTINIEKGESSYSQPTKSFYKIIIHGKDEHRMKLPKSFISKWLQNLPHTGRVTLKGPYGPIKQFKLVHEDDGSWLDEGCLDFKAYYSISHGHLLVFEYDRNSHFDVLIFDKTTTEIEHPSDNVIQQEGRTSITDEETTVAYQRAKEFKSVNPFLVSLMQPCFLNSMKIPSTFLREHSSKSSGSGKRKQLHFRVTGKKTWIVVCTVGVDGRANMSKGWKEFAKENGLKPGDVCIFEVIKNEDCLWNVTIFRN